MHSLYTLHDISSNECLVDLRNAQGTQSQNPSSTPEPQVRMSPAEGEQLHDDDAGTSSRRFPPSRAATGDHFYSVYSGEHVWLHSDGKKRTRCRNALNKRIYSIKLSNQLFYLLRNEQAVQTNF
eukprot:GHVU01125587.1.p2 GENE.GHVU01125587.1~~GHVU01125587.1.p2  ORF type:complete len:124 (+),score=6.41 GHVU01125587.1:1635-2006(+)